MSPSFLLPLSSEGSLRGRDPAVDLLRLNRLQRCEWLRVPAAQEVAVRLRAGVSVPGANGCLQLRMLLPASAKRIGAPGREQARGGQDPRVGHPTRNRIQVLVVAGSGWDRAQQALRVRVP